MHPDATAPPTPLPAEVRGLLVRQIGAALAAAWSRDEAHKQPEHNNAAPQGPTWAQLERTKP